MKFSVPKMILMIIIILMIIEGTLCSGATSTTCTITSSVTSFPSTGLKCSEIILKGYPPMTILNGNELEWRMINETMNEMENDYWNTFWTVAPILIPNCFNYAARSLCSSLYPACSLNSSSNSSNYSASSNTSYSGKNFHFYISLFSLFPFYSNHDHLSIDET